jgi:uncharacterized protein (TIGR03437 family)
VGRMVPAVGVAVALLSCLATAQTPNPVPVTAVSSASYAAAIAPDSLIAVFGSQLSRNVVSATLDAFGQLPTELDGTRVEINGRRAPLIFVSPGQVNCLAPAETEVDTATVVVYSTATGFVSRGSVTVRKSAPGLFALDSSGAGPGAVLNGVTNILGPFGISTPEIPGLDKRTRLAVYGTGFRLASSARAEVQEASGKTSTWAVEYAGAASIYFGLDQLNVTVPPEADGAGILYLRLVTETGASNAIQITIRDSHAPQFSSFTPLTISPGGELVITGAGFGGENASGPKGRNRLVFITSSGMETGVAPLASTPSSMTVLVPPIPAGQLGDWYQGSVRLCLEVDGQRVCHAQPLNLLLPASPAGSPGQLLTDLKRRLVENIVARLNQTAGSAAAQAAQADGQAALGELTALVSEAAAGQPRTVAFDNIDGSRQNIVFDIGTIRKIESLLASNEEIRRLLAGQPARAARLAADATGSDCALPDEQNLEQRKLAYEDLRANEQLIGALTLGAAVRSTSADLDSFSSVAQGTWATAVITHVLLASDQYLEQLWTEYQPNWLESVRTDGLPAAVTAGASANFRVMGRFTALSRENEKAAMLQATGARAALSTAKLLPAAKLQEDWAAAEIGRYLGKRASERISDAAAPKVSGGEFREVQLSAASVSAAPPELSGARIVLACGERPGEPATSRLIGKASTGAGGADFLLWANGQNVLQPIRVPLPAAGVTIRVNPPSTVCPSVGGSWNFSESGSASCVIDGESEIGSISGSGMLTIYQDAGSCGFYYDPVNPSGEPFDLRAGRRTGTIAGSQVTVTGLGAFPVPGAAFTKNEYTATGTYSEERIDLTGSGLMSGTYSDEEGSFSFSCTSSSTATLSRVRVAIDINLTSAEDDDITVLNPAPAPAVPVQARVTLRGGSGAVQLSVEPPGRAVLDKTVLTLADGGSGVITITPKAVSLQANDVTIKAVFDGQVAGAEDMTIASVTFPKPVDAPSTPQEMVQQQRYRIPPRVGTPVRVEVQPSLTGTGQALTLEVLYQSDAAGRVKINGQDRHDITETGDVNLAGTAQTAATGGTGGGNAGKLLLAAKAWGQRVVEQSNWFSVSTVPQYFSEFLLGPVDRVEDGVRVLGAAVQMMWDSDSNETADLDAAIISEQVETKRESGSLAGIPWKAGDFGSGDHYYIDGHTTLADTLLKSDGRLERHQVYTFHDRRMGVTHIPIRNSGYIITREVFWDIGRGQYRLRTSKVGADVTVYGQFSSAAGQVAGPAIIVEQP